MERKRLTLDSPVFAGKLRYDHRSSAYVRRPTQHFSASGMADVLTLVQTTPMQPKAQPAVHTPKPAAQPVFAVPRPAATLQAAGPMTTQVKPAAEGERLPRKLQIESKRTVVLYAMAGILFVGGLLVSWGGLRTNHQVAAQVRQSQQVSADTAGSTIGAPSTVKPSTTLVRNYAVAPNLPKYINIPKLKVHTRVLSEGIDKNGQLQVPWNIYDTGWYNSSSQPGQNGAMLVDGHSGIGNQHGVFYKLASLAAGDTISITRGDSKVFTYNVVKVQTVSVKSIDMNSMLVSADTSKPGLNLITCTGDQIPGTDQLNERIQVYAVLQ